MLKDTNPPPDVGLHPLISLSVSQRQGPYLVPGIRPIGGVDEDGDDLGLGDERSSSLRSFLRMEIVGTFLKEEVSGDIRRSGEEIHVPRKATSFSELLKSHTKVDESVKCILFYSNSLTAK